ncbi:MAG: CvpA family protein [Desulfosarcinaceae bacterium]|nr:CvpA family protein [Desulfosarcinaceae bacterium]
MNPFDILIIIIIVVTLIRGVFRGLVKELASIIGVLGGFYAAYSYYPFLGQPLGRWIPQPGWANIVSFLIIFTVIYLIVSILGVIIKYLLSIAFLGWVDRLCGTLFGAFKGVLICAVLLVALIAFLPASSNIVRASMLSPYVKKIAHPMARMVTKEMRQRYNHNAEEVEKTWRQKQN